MKKALIICALGLFLGGMASCGGGGHICPAYGGQKDYTKKKVEKVEQIQLIQKLSEKKA